MAGTTVQLGACKAHSVRHVQVGFKRELIKEVRLFVLDAQEFRQDWEANGPMVPGLDPMDAVDRLKKFQLMFEVCTLQHCSTICAYQSIFDPKQHSLYGIHHCSPVCCVLHETACNLN